MDNKFKTYKVTRIRGVDDLVSAYPYYGEWNIFNPFINITHEEYIKDISGYKRLVNQYNENYIAKLISENRYKEEYEVSFTVMHHEIFDRTENASYKNYGILIPRGELLNGNN